MRAIIFVNSLIIAGSIFLVSCSSKQTDPAANTTKQTDSAANSAYSQYLIVNFANRLSGAVTFYDSKSMTTSSISFPQGISDAIVSDTAIYVVSSTTPTITVLDKTKLKESTSFSYSKFTTGNYEKHLATFNDRLFVSDVYVNLPPISYLKIIHLDNPSVIDSMMIIKNYFVDNMVIADGKLFVHYKSNNASDNTNGLLVYDPNTYTYIGKIDGLTNVTRMARNKSGTLVATDGNYSFYFIDTNSLTVTKTVKLYVADFTLDVANDRMYFVRLAAQPAAAPYVLLGYKFSNDSSYWITNNFVEGPVIAYDNKLSTILLGSYNGVDAYSMGGTKGKTIITSYPPYRILNW